MVVKTIADRRSMWPIRRHRNPCRFLTVFSRDRKPCGHSVATVGRLPTNQSGWLEV